jgi:hypothetical protein
MKLSAGTKLASAVCAMQAIVIRPPEQEGVLTAGDAPMAVAGETPAAASQLSEPEAGHALPGKRYTDQASGLEVLCTKAGKAAMAFDGRALTLKEAKPLPASD